MSLSLTERRILSGVLLRNPSFNYVSCSRTIQKASQCSLTKEEAVSSKHKNFAVLLSALLGGSAYFVYQFFKNSNLVELRDSQEDTGEELGKSEKKQAKTSKAGFRDRKVVEYENRIKQFSTPDKIFRYYATIKIDHEVFMTPADFVRSIIPDTKQPEGLGLDKFRTFHPDEEVDVLPDDLPENSIFRQLGEHGLISFSDYVFLLTVLSTPPKNFEVAFKVFDINGDGIVEYQEFDDVASAIRASGSVGQRHRNHKTTGNVIQKSVSSGLAHYFFGPNLDKKLSIDDFLHFQEQVHKGVLQLEVLHLLSPQTDKYLNQKKMKSKKSPHVERFCQEQRMSEVQFCRLLLMYMPGSSSQDKEKKRKMLKRIRSIYKKKSQETEEDEVQDDPSCQQKIAVSDVFMFWELLNRLNEIEHAISFWTLSGAAIDKETFKHVAEIVGKNKISDYLVEVIFNLFDNDGDGMLSHKEFVSVMRNRASRGLNKPRELGFSRLFNACWSCVKVTDFLYPIWNRTLFSK